MPSPVGKLRRGMTVLERQKLREEILQAFLDRARKQAGEAGRSVTCIRGMQSHGKTAAYLHGRCVGEVQPNSGCLCECHDDNRGGVASGTAAEMGAGEAQSS